MYIIEYDETYVIVESIVSGMDIVYSFERVASVNKASQFETKEEAQEYINHFLKIYLDQESLFKIKDLDEQNKIDQEERDEKVKQDKEERWKKLSKKEREFILKNANKEDRQSILDEVNDKTDLSEYDVRFCCEKVLDRVITKYNLTIDEETKQQLLTEGE